MDWPTWIPLGIIDRPSKTRYKSPPKVRSAADLPSRIFIGDLVPETFQLTADGWQVEYRDADEGTGVELGYVRSRNHLGSTSRWHGEVGFINNADGSRFTHVAQPGVRLPENWEKIAQERLSARYNVRYVRDDEKADVIQYFPDGYHHSIILPIPVRRLRDCLSWFDALRENPAIRTPVSALLKLHWSVVNYPEFAHPEAFTNPAAYEENLFRVLGTPLLGHGEFQGPLEYRALTISRSHYTLSVGCFFREVERIVASLHEAALIGTGPLDRVYEGYPNGHEYGGIVLTAGMELALEELQLFDLPHTRRVCFPQLITREERSESERRLSREDVLREIGRAEELSAEFLKESGAA